MSKQYLADNVGADGTVYPTVGEHIRNALDVTGTEFRSALVNLLTGKSAYLGGLGCDALTTTELADIKAYLGIV